MRVARRGTLLLLVFLAAQLLVTIPAGASPMFSDDFESGSMAAWTSSTGLIAQQAIVHRGSWAARDTSGTAAWATRSISPVPALYYRAFVDLADQSTTTALLRVLPVTGSSLVTVGVNANHRLFTNIGGVGTKTSPTTPVGRGAWYALEVHVVVNGTSSKVEVWFDGALVPALSQKVALGSVQIGRVGIGDSTPGHSFDALFDDVVVRATFVDDAPPSKPTGLQAEGTSSRVDLSWNPSTDNAGVTGYTIYRDGNAIGTAPGGTTPTFSDSNVQAGTKYGYAVDAVDGAGHHSALSDTAEAMTTPADADPRPNIVFILTDDQRLNNSQQPGDTTISHMPIVQSQLAGKGVTFANGFDVNPLCCPSRSTILTGMDSGHTGVWNNKPPYGGFETFTNRHDDQSTIATWLNGAGYKTGFVGKYLNGYSPAYTSYVPPGWDTWDALALTSGTGVDAEGAPGYYNYSMSINGTSVSYGSTPTDYSTDVLSTYATDFISSVPSNKPLFLYLAPRAPHAPATAAPPDVKGCPNLPLNRPPNWNEPDVSDKPAYIQALPPVNRDGFNLRQCRSLLSVDRAVGNVLSALASTGRLNNTLILFASDNGLANGEHRWYKKTVPYEESLRVPVIARYDALSGQVPVSDPHLVLNMDFASTFADAAGVSTPSSVQGSSLLPLIEGSNPPWRSDFLIEHGGNVDVVPAYCGVRTEQYLYVRYSDGFEELYDLNADPFELQNLASKPALAARKADLHARMVSLCSPAPPGYGTP